MKRWLTALLAATLALGLAGCALRSNSAGKGTLRVGVREDIPNFGYRNPDSGRFYGFEVDLASTLAERLGYADVELVGVTVDTREALLNDGTVDCLIACYSITEERQEQFDLTAPYYYDNMVAVVENSSCFTSLSDLRDQTIGVLAGSTAAHFFTISMESLDRRGSRSDVANSFTFQEGESYDALSQALERGEVDAVCMDSSVAQQYLGGDGIYGDRARFAIFSTRQGYGVATRKGSPLSAPMAAAVDGLLADGTVDALVEKWS